MFEVPDFDAIYRADPDPFEVRSSFYEARKLDLLLACLARPTYATAWDPACGVGELAARLASRCDLVLASDASLEAVRLTSARCADLPAVTVVHQALHPALRDVVPLPVSIPTSCAFGGEGLRTLFVTTSRWDLSAEALAREPWAGGLLEIRTAVPGWPVARFAG